MDLVHPTAPRRRFGAIAALCAATLIALLAFAAGSGSAGAANACPGFRVLHNDRIGAASFPAGNYTITPATSSGLTCAAASKLFSRFLEDYDGVLPRPWRVVAQGSGKASFVQGAQQGFSVALSSSGGGGNNPALGKLCPGRFTVNATTVVGSLRFTRGQFLLYIPARSLISCRRASVLFTRFLSQPSGRLPFPWQLTNQTATFSKPQHPLRSAFRVEPLAGS